MLQHYCNTEDWQNVEQLVLCDVSHMLSSGLRLKHEEVRTERPLHEVD
jgi:hypothetical protein